MPTPIIDGKRTRKPRRIKRSIWCDRIGGGRLIRTATEEGWQFSTDSGRKVGKAIAERLIFQGQVVPDDPGMFPGAQPLSYKVAPRAE